MPQSLDCLRPDDPRPDAREALCAWLALQRHFAFRPVQARAALEACPEPERALRASGAPRSPGGGADLLALRRAGAVGVPFGSRLYPERLAQLRDAPPLLLVRGDPRLLRAPAVAMVGARAATAYGRGAARRFASACAEAGLLVVSGLATGIDGEAHAAALAAGGRSLAVLGCGPEQVYPRGHRRLAERLVERGAVVSEFPPGTPPRAPHFPLRNRIISALSGAVLVVEARLRSGSLVTARHAADQGVDVWAVPGPIDAATSQGTNRLLSEGAHPALSPEELLEGLEREGLLRPAPRVAASAPAAPLDPAAQAVLRTLRDAPLHRDALGRALALAPEALAQQLLELELAGLVGQDRDGRLRVLRDPELS